MHMHFIHLTYYASMSFGFCFRLKYIIQENQLKNLAILHTALILRKVGLLSGENIEKIIRSYRDPTPLFYFFGIYCNVFQSFCTVNMTQF